MEIVKNPSLNPVSLLSRTATALLLGTSVVAGVLGSPSPAHADDVIVRDHRDKDAWLEVVINKIIIHDDEDGFLKGAGEFNFEVVMGTMSCPDSLIWGACLQQLVKSDPIKFSADSGQTVTLNRVVPRMGDILSTSLDEDAGMTVHPGTQYGIEISGSESDVGTDDAMGWTHLMLNDSSDWAIGTHTIRGRQPRGFTFSGLLDDISCAVVDCSSQSSWAAASYSVELEVRRVALADLTPRSIKIVNRSTEKPPEQFKYLRHGGEHWAKGDRRLRRQLHDRRCAAYQELWIYLPGRGGRGVYPGAGSCSRRACFDCRYRWRAGDGPLEQRDEIHLRTHRP